MSNTNQMVEVTVKIPYNGNIYQTNVLVDKGETKKRIIYLAKSQVRQQWLKKESLN
ncbi:BA3454 family stress response protein [Oceanobacillus arenosus]|uniref:BA3454 family stress response protein n=1 Tax=Oceanobacillus arenosus TaxID=1229153 RepID=UPI001FEBD473|nr:BA3454 family stress response protein [Oceanobacillus arenosus]